ncbi:MAG: hypothetical protein RQ971_04710 [Armatimonadota bacterium]|nr:hypothetical protein [Armatimonadota bacterium]
MAPSPPVRVGIFQGYGRRLTLLRLHEICQYALRHPHRVGEREGASLLQVL